MAGKKTTSKKEAKNGDPESGGPVCSVSEKINLEDALAELEQITTDLESGTENLDESIERFERGMKLLKSCHQQLNSAARRIEIVTGIDSDGEISTEPFSDLSTISGQPVK